MAPSVLLVAAGLVVVGAFAPGLGRYDEGFALTNAHRLLAGEVPHRDYWSSYPPGTAGVLAVAFLVGGPSLGVARLVDAAWGLALLFGLLAALSRGANRGTALAAAPFAAWWIAAGLYPSYSATPGMALCAVAMAMLVRGVATGSAGMAAAAGVVAGVVLLFRHDFGFYFVAASCLALAVAYLVAGGRRAALRGVAAAYVAAAGATSVACLAALLLWVGWADFLDQAILFPATGMQEQRRLAVPGLFAPLLDEAQAWLMAWAAPVAAGVLAPCAWALRGRMAAHHAVMAALCVALASVLTLQAHSRLDLPHAAPSILFALVAGAAVLGAVPGRVRRVALPCALGLACAVSVALLPHSPSRRTLACAALQTQACMPVRADQRAAVAFVEAHVPRDAPVFVGNARHDRIFINDAALYFLLGRPVPVPWGEMHPGVANTEAVQRRIVALLEEQAVGHVVLVDMPLFDEPNASARSSGVFILDDHLDARFETVFTAGSYRVLARRGGAGSQAARAPQ